MRQIGKLFFRGCLEDVRDADRLRIFRAIKRYNKRLQFRDRRGNRRSGAARPTGPAAGGDGARRSGPDMATLADVWVVGSYDAFLAPKSPLLRCG